MRSRRRSRRCAGSARCATRPACSGCGASRPPPAAMPTTGRTSSRRRSASAASTSRCSPARARRKLSALGVVSGIYRPDGIVGDLGGGSLELVDVHGHQLRHGITLPLGSLALQDLSEKSVKKAEKIVRKALGGAPLLRRGEGRTLLRGRRHLARARAAAHVADRLSAARDARLRHPGARGAGVFPPGASGQSRDALAHRDGQRGAPPAARLCGAGARARRAHHAAARDRDLGARRARGAALFGTAGARARARTA